MHLILATKAGRKTVIASSGQPAPEARYLHAVSTKYELRASKFFLQLNSLDFRINRSTCKPFLVKGNVVQPPPSPGEHVMPDYSKSTQRARGVCHKQLDQARSCSPELHPHSLRAPQLLRKCKTEKGL